MNAKLGHPKSIVWQYVKERNNKFQCKFCLTVICNNSRKIKNHMIRVCKSCPKFIKKSLDLENKRMGHNQAFKLKVIPTVIVPTKPSPSLLTNLTLCKEPGKNFVDDEEFDDSSNESNGKVISPEEYTELLNGYRDCLLNYSKHCKCYQNYTNKSKFNELEFKYRKIFNNYQNKVYENEELISKSELMINKSSSEDIRNQNEDNYRPMEVSVEKKSMKSSQIHNKPLIKTYSRNSKTDDSDSFQYITKSLSSSESLKTLQSICRRDGGTDNKNEKLNFVDIECQSSICDICGKDYKEIEVLIKHKILFHKKNPLICNFCKYVNKKGDLQEFKEHKLKHIKTEGNAICDNQSEQIDEQLESGLKKVNRKTKKDMFECQLCEAVCEGKRQLNEHLISAHYYDQLFNSLNKETNISPENEDTMDTDVKPLPCLVLGCHQTFTVSTDLERHLLGSHPTERPYVCDYNNCGRNFQTKITLLTHRLRHMGAKTYACEWHECGDRFSSLDDYNTHHKIHTQRHKCPVLGCLKSYSVKRDLQTCQHSVKREHFENTSNK